MSLRSEMILDAKLVMRDGRAVIEPPTVIDGKGYVRRWQENLLPGIKASLVERDLGPGKGSELDRKFKATHSSAALAVNVFAPILGGSREFSMPGFGALKLEGFEKTFSTGLAGRIPPHLDALAAGPEGLVAIESKCLEYFTPKAADFSLDYRTLVNCRGTSWYAEMERLREAPRDYQCLDAAQLIKHAFGLIASAPATATLLYLYWEPTDAAYHALFSDHRDEIDRFASRVAGSGPVFRSMSYPELWTSWRESPDEFLRAHAMTLFTRYGGALGGYEGYSRIDGRKTDVGFFDENI